MHPTTLQNLAAQHISEMNREADALRLARVGNRGDYLRVAQRARLTAIGILLVTLLASALG